MKSDKMKNYPLTPKDNFTLKKTAVFVFTIRGQTINTKRANEIMSNEVGDVKFWNNDDDGDDGDVL